MAERGFTRVTRHTATDDPRAIASCLARAAKTSQVVILTGGVSVGQYDFVPEAIERIGGKIRFHGVNMKPGQPQPLRDVAAKSAHLRPAGQPGQRPDRLL